MSRLFLLIAFFVTVTLVHGFNFDMRDEEFDNWVRGIPAASGSNKNKCKKDMLIVWDLSRSIPSHIFASHVRPFIRRMILNDDLNVGPTGTHVAMILFSQLDKTKLLFDFGTYLTRADLVKQIDAVDWKKQGRGGYTETARALEIANDDVFTKNSPLNGRPDVDDILVLFTDGQPHFKKWTKNATADTLVEVDRLKKKNVHIITLGTGDTDGNGNLKIDKQMKDFLMATATTPKDYFHASFQKLDNIIDSMIGASCRAIKPGQCSCDTLGTVTHIQSSEPDIKVNWKIPQFKCNSKPVKPPKLTAKPNIFPPARFKAGKHLITYTYDFSLFSLPCNVEIDIQPCNCQKVPDVLLYVASKTAKVSAKWKIPKPDCHPTTPSDNTVVMPESLGVGSYQRSYVYSLHGGSKLTCNVNIVVKACGCEQFSKVVAYTGKNSKTSVSWKIPKPLCELSSSHINNVAMPQSFGAGNHRVVYEYRLKTRTTLKCPVDIEIKECSCPPTQTIVKRVKPVAPYTGQVTWTVPKPCSNVPGVKLVSVSPANTSPGQTFKLGRHVVRYTYSINGAQMTCPVEFELKVVPCQGQEYNPAQEECCCGKKVDKRVGWSCCGRKHYDTSRYKCCATNWNLVGKFDKCPDSD